MASQKMEGPYELKAEKIDEVITKTSAGNYLLGHTRKGEFKVQYVGRSDSDLNKRLKEHVGDYWSFKFCYASSPKAAFERECEDYHDNGGADKLDNKFHPGRPDDTDWKCPRCPCFE